MKTLWAPWRMEYILRSVKSPRSKKCVFCQAIHGRPSEKNLVLKRGRCCYVIMNRYPYTSGHLMVIPNRHTDDFSRLTREEHTEMGELLSLSAAVLCRSLSAQGFNIGMNLGTVAGAGIKDHLHYHIVPRWQGDNNFMPVLADVRMIYEHMTETYRKLFKEFSDC